MGASESYERVRQYLYTVMCGLMSQQEKENFGHNTSPASILLTSAEGFQSLIDCQVGCTACTSGCASPLPLHFFGATGPAASSSSLSFTSTSSSPLEVAEGGSMV